jgi:hypothetical protein
MRCDEAAEFVSALCDGEVIPRAAAQHVGTCAACQERWREYMEMGAEVRLMASLAMDERVTPRVWNGSRSRLANLWQKGWQTMRVPRFALAVLVVAIVALSSAFAVVQVRAHESGSVVLLKFAWPGRTSTSCPLSTVDKKWMTCSYLGPMNGKMIGFQIDLIGRKGDGVELAVRTKTFGSLSGSFSLSDVRNEPQKQVYFEPGQAATLDVAGGGTLSVTGEWLDHMPVFLGSSGQDAQAGPEELRLVSPMLIGDKQVLGDLQGGSAVADKAGQGVAVSLPGQGRFLLALSPMRGAVQARVAANRISFEEGGHSYVFVTGAPVCRGDHLWVLRDTNFKQDPEHGSIGSVSAGEMKRLAPDVVDGEGAK